MAASLTEILRFIEKHWFRVPGLVLGLLAVPVLSLWITLPKVLETA